MIAVISVEGPWSQNQNLHLYFAPKVFALRARALYGEINDEIKDEIMEINDIKEIHEINEINRRNQ